MKKLYILIIFCVAMEGSVQSMEKGDGFKKPFLKKGDYGVIVQDKVYNIASQHLKNSVTLSNMFSSVHNVNDPVLLPDITKNVWESVILPALQEGPMYVLSDDFVPEQLVAIINAADYLDIEYLYEAALKKSAEYIKRNIDLLTKDSNVFAAFKNLPADVLEIIISQIINKYMVVGLFETLKGHMGSISSMAFSFDSTILASAGHDRIIKLWDINTGKEKKTFQGYASFIRSVAFSIDGKTLASGSLDGVIKFLDVGTGKLISEFRDRSLVVFSRDLKSLASWSGDETIDLWNIHTHKKINISVGNNNVVVSVAFNPDGSIVASGLLDGDVKLWNAVTGNEMKTFNGHQKSVMSVAFSSDGTILASGARDKTIKLWDVRSGNLIKTLNDVDVVRFVAFSPDGKVLASSSGDNVIRLWDVEKGTEIRLLKGHTSPVTSVVFSSNGAWLAAGAVDGTIKVWSVADIDFDFDQALFVYYALKHKKIDTKSDVYATFTEEQKKMLHTAIQK